MEIITINLPYGKKLQLKNMLKMDSGYDVATLMYAMEPENIGKYNPHSLTMNMYRLMSMGAATDETKKFVAGLSLEECNMAFEIWTHMSVDDSYETIELVDELKAMMLEPDIQEPEYGTKWKPFWLKNKDN